MIILKQKEFNIVKFRGTIPKRLGNIAKSKVKSDPYRLDSTLGLVTGAGTGMLTTALTAQTCPGLAIGAAATAGASVVGSYAAKKAAPEIANIHAKTKYNFRRLKTAYKVKTERPGLIKNDTGIFKQKQSITIPSKISIPTMQPSLVPA